MDETVKILHRIMVFGGIYFCSNREWTSKLRLIHQIFNFVCVCTSSVFCTGFLIDSHSNIAVFLEGIGVWCCGLTVCVSFGICLVFKNEFRMFFEKMIFKDEISTMPFIEHFVKTESGEKLEELKKIMEDSHDKYFKYTNIFVKVYLGLTGVGMTFYTCDSVYNFITTVDTSRPLIFLMSFPWSLENLNVYIITLILNVYYGYQYCIGYVGFQSVIILLISQHIRHLRIIAFIVQHLDKLILELCHERDERWQKLCTTVLSQCIEQYVKIKRFNNTLNEICKPFYLILLLETCLLGCLNTVQVVINSSTVSFGVAKFFCDGFYYMAMALLFCLFGQQVQIECDNLENAVTEKWYLFNQKHKKNVCIFHAAVSQGMPIYIYGSVTLSKMTFVWVFKTTVSFFTVVMSVIKN